MTIQSEVTAPTRNQASAPPRHRLSVLDVRRLLLDNAILLALIMLFIAFSVSAHGFFAVDNLRDVLTESSVLTVVAVPMTFVVVGGGLDLSVGSTLALTGVIAGRMLVAHDNPVIAVVAALAVGGAVGIVNGVLISVMGYSTIVVTLGTLTAVRGLALAIGAAPIFGFSTGFDDLGQGSAGGVPYPVIIAVATLIVGWLMLTQTPFGRHVFAVGVNRRAAFVSGVAVRKTGFLCFVATGLASGLAGIMEISRLASAPANSLGDGFEIDVLTAVLLGGVAFSGGRGSLIKVGFGILFLGLLSNGLILLNVSTPWSDVVQGTALVVGAGLALATGRFSRRT